MNVVYDIVWCGPLGNEVVDTFDDEKEALEMVREYRLAFEGSVRSMKVIVVERRTSDEGRN